MTGVVVDLFTGLPRLPKVNKKTMGPALTEFVQHCEEGWDEERFGVFLWDRKSSSVVYLRGHGVSVVDDFSMDPEWLAGVLDERVSVRRAGSRRAEVVRRYCLLGIGHSHPGGSSVPSVQDLQGCVSVLEWRRATESPLFAGNWILARTGIDARCLVQYTGEGVVSQYSYQV